MKTRKSTKRALLMSALSILMCVSMLIGTTYAWFTDSVTSAGNIIKSGKLEVTMEWKDAANGQQQTYVDASAGPIFNYEKWEPGYVEAKNIKISNVGTLALKYQLNILAEETVSILADVIDVYFAEGEYTLANRDMSELKLVGTLADVLAGMPANMSGDLEAGKNDTVTIALKMQESAGNEYQNKSIGSKFTVQLLATQLTSEFDSFDNQYDAEATLGTYIELNAGDDLLAAMASAKADMPLTIKLNGDVEWPTEGHHGENDITPASSIVINGNGNTITATGSGVTPLGDTEAPMTLKNVTIVDKSVSYAEGAWEFTYLEIGGSSFICDNVTFADEIQLGTVATFTNCSFESNEESVYAVWVEDGSATFNNCTFTGYRGLKAHEDYGSEVNSVIVKNCTFSNIAKKPGIALGTLNADTTVSITGSRFINCQAGDQNLYIYETDTDVTTIKFTEENNDVLNNATVVSSKDDLLALSAKTLTGNNGVAEEAIIVIDADIDMKDAEFSAVIAQRGDKLIIIGNGHKISNVKAVSGANDNTTGQASMFYAYPNSTLKVSDLTLENITVTADANGTGYAAAVVGYCEGNAVLNNVDVVNATVTGVKSSGMLVGHLSGSLEATDCDLSGTVTLADFAEEANGHYAAKYIGTLAGAATLTNCTADVTVSGNLNAANIGDFYGRKVSGSLTYNAKEGETMNLLAKNYGEVKLGSLKNVTIKGAENTTAIFKIDATSKIENVTLQKVEFKYTGATADCGVVIDPAAQIENLVLDGCTFTGTGAKAGRGLSGYNNNASIVIKDCTFKDLGYPIYAWGGYESLTVDNCTFVNIKSWAIMPQSGFNGDLTVNNCKFVDCLGGGLIKAGTLTAGHTFTFTNNTVTGCTVAGDHNWFQFNVSAGTAVIENNTMDGTAWTPSTADGLK